MDQVLGVIGFMLLVVGGLLILTFLVVIHELGHAIVARRNGVIVEEFGIGFPPKAWSKKLKNGVLFSINWLPLGGFVKLKGEHDEATGKGSYGGATMWQKSKILLAGVTMNWLFAALLFMVLSVVGLPKIIPSQYEVPGATTVKTGNVTIDAVGSGTPAAKLGLKADDKILAINGIKVANSDQLRGTTKKDAGQNVAITYKRHDKTYTRSVTLNPTNRAQNGYLGVSTSEQATVYTAWYAAPVEGVGLAVQFSWETIKGLGVLLAQLGQGVVSKFSPDHTVQQNGQTALNAAGAGVSGPVGILFNLFPTFEKAGIVPLLVLTAVISLTLAIMNVLPIPALDGGRLYLALVFKALKKRLTKEREEKIVGYSFYALILLVLFITILDVGKFFTH